MRNFYLIFASALAVVVFGPGYDLLASCQKSFKSYRHPAYLMFVVSESHVPLKDRRYFTNSDVSLKQLIKTSADVIPDIAPGQNISGQGDAGWMQIFEARRVLLQHWSDDNNAELNDATYGFLKAMFEFFAPDRDSLVEILKRSDIDSNVIDHNGAVIPRVLRRSGDIWLLSTPHAALFDAMLQVMSMQLYGQRLVIGREDTQKLFEKIDIGTLQRIRNHVQIIRTLQHEGVLKKPFFKNLVDADRYLHHFSQWATAGRSFRTTNVVASFSELESSLGGLRSLIRPRLRFDEYDHYFEFYPDGIYLDMINQLDKDLAHWMDRDESLRPWMNDEGSVSREVRTKVREMIEGFFEAEGYTQALGKLKQDSSTKVEAPLKHLAAVLEKRFGAHQAKQFAMLYWGYFGNGQPSTTHEVFQYSLSASTFIQTQEFRLLTLRHLLDQASLQKTFDGSALRDQRADKILGWMNRESSRIDPSEFIALQTLIEKGAYLSFERLALKSLLTIYYNRNVGRSVPLSEMTTLLAFDIVKTIKQRFNYDAMGLQIQLYHVFQHQTDVSTLAAEDDPDQVLIKNHGAISFNQLIFDAMSELLSK
jgi:hypothetical protein